MNNALITAVIAISFMVGVFAGGIRATSIIQGECKSFQATVIRGEKFRCEQVKE